MATRKAPFALAVNLRELRKQRGKTVEQAADILAVADSKYALALEGRSRHITLERAARAAYGYQAAIIVDIEDVGAVSVQRADRPTAMVDIKSPGEEAWEALLEQQESIECLPGLQRALLRGDRVELARLYRECVLEPIQAARRLAAALDAQDPTLKAEAMIWETQERLGFRPSILEPRHRLAKEA